MLLRVQPLNDSVRALYASHGHYHAGDSGLDFFIVEDQTIKAGETAFVKLGIKAAAYVADTSATNHACPATSAQTNGSSTGNEQTHGQQLTKNVSWLLMPRSSISKTPLRLANSVGLIDAGYRGELMAAVDNIKQTDYTLRKGDRIVQAVAFTGESITLELVNDLDKTTRGEGGFGSTSA